MIPLRNKGGSQQLRSPITYSSQQSKSQLSNRLSTSPHSLHSPRAINARLLKSVSSSKPNLSSTDSLRGQIKITLYNHICVLDSGEGEKCMQTLQKTLEGWGVSQRTKINMKMLVSHSLCQSNAKMGHIFEATVRQYECLQQQIE